MTDKITPLHDRCLAILKGWETGLAGRDPNTVEIQELLPAIFEAVPDTTIPEIREALRWGSRQFAREADELERFKRAKWPEK
jgi:hypothetical protein